MYKVNLSTSKTTKTTDTKTNTDKKSGTVVVAVPARERDRTSTEVKGSVGLSPAAVAKSVDPAPVSLTVEKKKKKKKAKHTYSKVMSDKLIARIDQWVADGYSDYWIAEQAPCIKRGIGVNQVCHARWRRWDLVDSNGHCGIGRPKPTSKNKNPHKIKKPKPTSFGQPNGNMHWREMVKRLDPSTGLPVGVTNVKPVGTRDIGKLITQCLDMSKQELRMCIKHKQLDGRGLSAGSLMIVRQCLVTLTGSAKESLAATKWLVERKYGATTVKIANGDGSNISNPLLALLTSDSKLKVKH